MNLSQKFEEVIIYALDERAFELTTFELQLRLMQAGEDPTQLENVCDREELSLVYINDGELVKETWTAHTTRGGTIWYGSYE